MRYKVFSDGASRGNPGLAGCGFVIYDENDNVITEKAFPIGVSTNNIAEYSAVIAAANAIDELKPEFTTFYLDSELIVKQVKGEYRVKDEKLKPLYLKLRNIIDNLKYEIKHVPRAENKVADKLSNIGTDMNN